MAYGYIALCNDVILIEMPLSVITVLGNSYGGYFMLVAICCERRGDAQEGEVVVG